VIRRLPTALLLAALVGILFVSWLTPKTNAATTTTISLSGPQFLINGVPTYAGTASQGILLNSRMIQGVFDDENAATVGNWAYPDTHVWDPQRNTNELVAALPSYASSGLRLITIGLQGGCPNCGGVNGQNITSAFNADGSLKAAWLSRLDQVIRAASANGMVVDVSLFYNKQVGRLAGSAAIQTGINNVVDWLDTGGYTNVLLETANECNIGGFPPPADCASQPTTIAGIQQRSGGKLKVSVSYTGGTIPDASVVQQADFVTLHGNGVSASGIQSMVAQVRAMPAYQVNPKPIIFNEDSTSTANLDAAAQASASWGYYDQGANNYVDGFQSPPTNWSINTSNKQAFFSAVGTLALAASPTAVAVTSSPTPSTQSVQDFTLINTTTQMPVSGDDPIPNGATINLAQTGGSLNIRANTAPALVGSVIFGYDGNTNYHTENAAPYDIPGDTNGVYAGFTPTLGSHTVTATAYSAANGGGTKGGVSTVTFTVVNATPVPTMTASPSTPTPGASSTATATVSPTPTAVPTAPPTSTVAPTATIPPPTATPSPLPAASSTPTVAPTVVATATVSASPTATPLTFNFVVNLSCTYDSSRTPTVTCVAQ
jgi:hypothetical protein